MVFYSAISNINNAFIRNGVESLEIRAKNSVNSIILKSNNPSSTAPSGWIDFKKYSGINFYRDTGNGDTLAWNIPAVKFYHYSTSINPSPTTLTKLSSIVVWIPAYSFFIFRGALTWGNSKPKEIALGNYDVDAVANVWVRQNVRSDMNHISVTHFGFTGSAIPVCVWGSWENSTLNYYDVDIACFSPDSYNS